MIDGNAARNIMSTGNAANRSVVNIDMNKAICPLYKKIVYKALNFEVDEIVFKGGRSSMKSSVMIAIGILAVIKEKRSAVFIIRYNNAVSQRLMAPLSKMMHILGVNNLFKRNKTTSEYELVGYEGVKIQCIGADNPENIKSISSEKDSYCVIGFEELNNFKSLEDVLNIQATFDRGVRKVVIYAFNPKRVNNDWCNEEFDRPCGKQLGHNKNVYIEKFRKAVSVVIDGRKTLKTVKTTRVIFHSTIYDIIDVGWFEILGQGTIAKAERLKSKSLNTFKWMWLGENVPIPGVRIFNNIVEWDGNRNTCFNELGLDEVFRGMDFGQGKHYTTYVETMFDEVNMDLYLIAEYGEIGTDFRNFSEEVIKINKNNFPMKCDYATVLAREQCEKHGLNLENCYKPEREMRYKFFSDDIRHIYINPELTPMCYKTFKQAEYEVNRQGDISSKPSKENDDFIDAAMYSLSDILKNNR